MQISNKINNLIIMQKRSIASQIFDIETLKKTQKMKKVNINKLVESFYVSHNVKTKQIKILQMALPSSAQTEKRPFIVTQCQRKQETDSFNHQIFLQLKDKAKAQMLQSMKTSSNLFYKTNPNVNHGKNKNRTISPQKNTFIIDGQYPITAAFTSESKKTKKCISKRKIYEKLPNNFYQKKDPISQQEKQLQFKQIIVDEHVSRSLNLITRQKKNEQNNNTNQINYENKSGAVIYHKPKPKIERNGQLRKTMKQIGQQQRRMKLQLKRQINQDYAKPFNPPTNITAASYIIFQPNFSENKQKKKYHYWNLQQNKDVQKERGKSEGNGNKQNRKKYPHSHKIIAAFNSRNSVQIASLTKIMTCILALQICSKYKLESSQQKILIGKFQSNIGGTTAQISEGQTYTLQDLYYGLMLPSGNDASVAIAVWAGRQLLSHQQPMQLITHKKKNFYERFIQQMNNKAKQLGMQKTNYANSHGLMNIDNRSCAYDLAILCQHAMNNNKFKEIVSCKYYTNTIQYNPNLNYPNLVKKRSSTKDLYKDKFKDDEIQQGQDKQLDSNQQQNTEEMNGQANAKRVVEWENTHLLVQQKPKQYIGIKTGITEAAGPCLASCIKAKNGRCFIIIVLNCEKTSMRFKDTENLKKWVYQREGIIKNIENQTNKQPSSAKLTREGC